MLNEKKFSSQRLNTTLFHLHSIFKMIKLLKWKQVRGKESIVGRRDRCSYKRAT